MGQKRIIIGFQDQKPLGTQVEDFEFSLYSCYKPLLTYLYAQPELKIALYLSASVYEWMESAYPEINMLIADMVKRKQLELLSGGFYDPILQIIPMKDRTQQIEMTTTFIRKRFGFRPRSIWITDQVWNPVLISSLATCGMKSVIQHDTPAEKRTEPFLMQEMGNSLTIYPVNRQLTNALIHKDVDFIRHALSTGSRNMDDDSTMTVMLDVNTVISNSIIGDPHTIIELCRILQEVCEELGISLTLPMNIQDEQPGRSGFLPSGWYRETLPEEGMHFNEIFLRYPEMRQIYGKMLYVSRLIPGIKREKSLKKIAGKELLKAQSFGSYSISQNGGIYQNYLRKENYQHMIEVEKLTRERGVFSTSITSYDVDIDGEDEFIYRGKNITAVFDRYGASMIELDYLVNSWNYLDTFVGNSSEIVHATLEHIPDGVLQKTCTDLFIEKTADAVSYDKYGNDHVFSLEDEKYELERLVKDQKNISFLIKTPIPFQKNSEVQIRKTYTCHTNTIQLDYTIENLSKGRLNCLFASELNLSFAFDSEEMLEIASHEVNLVREMKPGDTQLRNVKVLRLRDLHTKAIVSVLSDKRYTVIRESYNTTIHSQMGEEDIYQYTRLLPIWEIDMKPGESWETTISIRIEKLK